MTIPFVPSTEFTVGMEMEFALLDEHSLDLTEGILPLMELYPDRDIVKPEFIQNTVEVASLPCSDVIQLESHVAVTVRGLIQRAHGLHMRLAGIGLHPFGRALAHVTPLPRYQNMAEKYGMTAQTQITFATHVHVAVGSAAEAITLMAELKTLLPVLIAVAANSPFYQGNDTGYASYRRVILSGSRTYGQPPDFPDWAAFSTFIERSIRAGTIQSVNDLHWDIRPRPHLGTLEVRAMDAQLTVSEACSLAALVRALVRYLRRTRSDTQSRPVQPVPWYVHKDNCFLAARDGMDALLIVNDQGDTQPLADLLQRVLEDLEGDIVTAERPLIDRLRSRIASGSLGYQSQQRQRGKHVTWEAMLLAQCDKLEIDVGPD